MEKNELLINYKKEVDKIIDISDAQWSFLISNSTLKKYKRKDILLEFNEISNEFFLIVDGYIQLFHIADKKEYTIDFFSPPYFVTSYESFLHRTPSKLCIKAISDITVLVLDYETIDEAYKFHPELHELSRIITELSLLSRLRSEYYNNSFSAKEKYLHLLENHPDLVNNLNQKQIASYIGIAPGSLSRIKKGINN